MTELFRKKQLKAFRCFRKKLCHRCSTGYTYEKDEISMMKLRLIKSLRLLQSVAFLIYCLHSFVYETPQLVLIQNFCTKKYIDRRFLEQILKATINISSLQPTKLSYPFLHALAISQPRHLLLAYITCFVWNRRRCKEQTYQRTYECIR